MSELSGSLTSIDIARVVRFLSSMGKSGGVVVSKWPWVGELSMLNGRLVAAAIENEHGPNALELIAVGLRGGVFEFSPSSGAPSLSLNLAQEPDPIAELERLAALGTRSWLTYIESPLAVPHVVPVRPSIDDTAAFTLDHETVYVLLDIDAQRTVRDLAKRHGLMRTLYALERLRGLGLIAFDELPPAAAPTQTRKALLSTAASRSDGRLSGFRDRILRFGAAVRRSGFLQAVVITGVLVLGIRSVVQNFQVEGVSMLPSFGGGQVLVVNRVAYPRVDGTPLAAVLPSTRQGSTEYLFGGPQRGDVVVFHSRVEPGTDFIKRVVGLPGDLVLVRNGRVYVNGDPLDEPYVAFPADYSFPPQGGALSVPDRQYFVLGDNRPESFDSHSGWLVSVDDLIGRAWLRYWPPSALGIVQAGATRVAQGESESSSAVNMSTKGLP